MKANNVHSKKEFIINHSFCAVLAMIAYRLIFRCIDGCSLATSRIILWSMLIVTCVLGITLNIEKRRNDITLAMNLSVCFGLYTVLSYWNIVHRLITVTAIVVAVVAALFGLVVFGRKIRYRDRYSAILRSRLERFAVGTQFITSCGMLVIVATLGISAVFNQTVLNAAVMPATEKNVEEYTIDRQMDTLVQLHGDNWKNLTIQERLNVLQVVANIEQRHLGTSTELNVGVNNLDKSLYGYYDDKSHRIVLSVGLLQQSSPWLAIQTVCHESYHSYQHRLIDLYNETDEKSRQLMIFDDIRQFKKEFADYQDSEKDFEAYYLQKCESTAREYGTQGMIEYYTRIDRYMENQ
jgi:hypothetical protein